MAATSTTTASPLKGHAMPNPQVVVWKMNTENQMKRTYVALHSLFNEKKNCIIFTFPGAFSPTCDGKHLPTILSQKGECKKHDIKVICITTDNMHAVEKWNPSDETIVMASDPQRLFGKATGLLDVENPDPTLGGAEFPVLGRNSISIVNGVVIEVNREPRAACEKTKGDVALAQVIAALAPTSIMAAAKK